MSSIRRLHHEEIIFSSQEIPDSSLSPVVIARCISGDYRLAEAQIHRDPTVHRIQKIRTLLSRGKILEARFFIEAGAGESDSRVQTMVETARALSFEGDWSASLLTVNSLLSSNEVSGLTLLTSLQIRTNALFELREYMKAQIEYENASHLAQLYPYAPVRFYLDALGSKISLKLGKLRESESLFHSLLKRARGNSRGINPDEVLTLLRLRSYINRETGNASRIWARAGYWLARSMGDDLYAALGLFDCYPVKELRLNLSEELRAAEVRFERMRNLLRSANGVSPYTDAVVSNERCKEPAYTVEEISLPDALYIIPWKMRIDFRAVEIKRWEDTEQSIRILSFIGHTREFSRKDLFENVWGLPFKPHQHQSTLTMALKRFRARSGLQLGRDPGQNGKIQSPVVSLIP